MSTFHKPKVFRSTVGCCICQTKSSSSRFTDSARYEEQFQPCFKLAEERVGEICNACVLLVKRWQKLPRGSKRDWAHVVDARAGPGGRSNSRVSSLKRKNEEEAGGLYKIRRKKTRKPQPVTQVEEMEVQVSGKEAALRRLQQEPLSSFLTSSSYWTKVKAGCSCLLVKGLEGECVVDPLYTCKAARAPLSTIMESLIEAELAALASVETKSRSGESVDLGYASICGSTLGDTRSTASPDSVRTLDRASNSPDSCGIDLTIVDNRRSSVSPDSMGNEERVKSEDIVTEEEDAEETLRAKDSMVGCSKEKMRRDERPLLCLESRLSTSAEMRGLNNECKNI